MIQSSKQNCKPWRSFKQQVDVLETRGMIFNDKVYAEHILSQVNYYRLSGYWYPFRKIMLNAIRSDEFMEGTRFTDVLNIYLFDKQLRILCLQALEVIEMSIRTNIAHTLGRISPISHLNQNNFNRDFVEGRKNPSITYQKWVDKYYEQIDRANKTPFIKHHNDNYSDIPIWVGIEVLDFGSISILYSGLKRKQQVKISQVYDVSNVDTFISWLRALNYIRNVCAHHGRLWNANIDVIAKQDRSIKGLAHVNNKRSFFYLLIMKYLLEIMEVDSLWAKEVKQLLLQFPEPNNKAIRLSGLGFTKWDDWASVSKFKP